MPLNRPPSLPNFGCGWKPRYEYKWTVCNPLDMKADVRLTASGALFVAVGGFAKIIALQGGVSLEVDVVKLSVIPSLNASYSLAKDFEACLTVPLEITALSGAIKVWAERIKLVGGWKRFFEKTVWEFTVLAYQKDLVSPKCWVP